MLELSKELKGLTNIEKLRSLADYYFQKEEYDIALLIYYKCFVMADRIFMLISIEKALEKYNTIGYHNKAEIDAFQQKVVKTIYSIIEQEWSKYEKREEIESNKLLCDFNYFINRGEEEFAWKVFQLHFFQELEFDSKNFIEQVFTMASYAKNCKRLFKEVLQKERDEFVYQQKSYLLKKLKDENNWIEVQCDFWFDDILEVFHDDLGWFDLSEQLIKLEIKRCQKYSIGIDLYELGVLIGDKRHGDKRALNLIIEGLSKLDETSQYWFFKSGIYENLSDLRDAFKCLSSESQEELFRFVMKYENLILKVPIYIQIYPVLKSAKIKEEIRQPMIEGEKNSKKISMVLEPSLELDKIIDYAIQEAKKYKNDSWISLLISRLNDEYPSHSKLKELNMVYKELQE